MNINEHIQRIIQYKDLLQSKYLLPIRSTMTLPMSFRPLREKTSVMRSRYLFEIYMREGDQQMKKGQYRKAVESYDAALQLNATNIAAYVAKSKCHQRLGLLKQAMADTEMALAIDNIFPPAVLQKANIFYTLANYEMALLFYHRGYKVDPGEVAFTDGIAKCQRHISDTRKRKSMKLTAAGDLTIYVHKKMTRDRYKNQEPIPEEPWRGMNSAGRIRRKKYVNPFVRLGRKQPVKLSLSLRKTNQKADIKRRSVSRSSGGTVFSEPDEKTQRELLGELYGDSIYLKGVYRETENGESRVGAEVHSLAESGLRFLLNRITYWNYRRLQPAPTPSPPLSSKRSRQGSSPKRTFIESPLPRQKSSLWEREVSDLIRLLNTGEPQEETITDEHIIEGYRPYIKEKKKVKQLNFEFATYRPGSDFDGRERERVDTSERASDTQGSIGEHLEEEDHIMNYLLKELPVIEKAFDDEDFSECKGLAVSCLQTVYSYSEEELDDKLDLVAKVHSLLGNAHMELQNVTEAQEHHEKDLDIGEKCNLKEAVSRSLGNLGRVFIHKKLFHKALGAFARKMKLVERTDEKAWLFHEIGDCFLCLNLYGYARAAGRKSLEAAERDEHRMYQLQACVLIGVAQVKLLEYNAAYEEFERALDLAKIEGDKDSEEMIARALQEVNSLITERTRKLTVQAQEVKQSKQEALVKEEQTVKETCEKPEIQSRQEKEIAYPPHLQPQQPGETELATVQEESTEADTELSEKSDTPLRDGEEEGRPASTHAHPELPGDKESMTTTMEPSEEYQTESSGTEGSPHSLGKRSGDVSTSFHLDKERDVDDDQKSAIKLERQTPVDQPESYLQTETNTLSKESIQLSSTKSVSESETSVRDKPSETTRSPENETLTSRPGSSETQASTSRHLQTLTEKKSETSSSPTSHHRPGTPDMSEHTTPSLNDGTKLKPSDQLEKNSSQNILYRSDQSSIADDEGVSHLIENAENGLQQNGTFTSPVVTNGSVSSDEHMSVNMEAVAQQSLDDRHATSQQGSLPSRQSVENLT